MHVMGEIKRAQELRVDEVSVPIVKRKSRDNTKAHFPVAGNARTDEFYERFRRISKAEWYKSGRLSHVSSQPVMIPSSRALLSRDKRLPLDIWNQSGFQEDVFGNQFSTLDSPRDHPQRTQSDDVQRNREAVPEAGRTKTIHTGEDRLNHGTIPMPTFAPKPLTTSSTVPMEVPQNYVVGQQRQQYLERIFQNLRRWTRRLAWLWTRSFRIPSSKRRSVSRKRKPTKRTGFHEEDRSLSWSATKFEWLALMTQY